MKISVLVFIPLFFLISCETSVTSNQKVQIVSTTNIIGNCLENILDTSIFTVQSLMGPGVDPHKYKATHTDIKLLNQADIIVYNGLHLEGKMSQIFEKLSQNRKVISIGNYVKKDRLILIDSLASLYDPHIWFDISIWKEALELAHKQILTWYPMAKTVEAKEYFKKLDRLSMWCNDELTSIPKKNRVLITSHDAFSYLAQHEYFEVRALQGISTVSEFGLKDIISLVDFVVENKIPSIFIENSIHPKSIQSVIKGAEKKGHLVALGGELYSDALGNPGTPQGTYVGMIKYNVETIKQGLSK